MECARICEEKELPAGDLLARFTLGIYIYMFIDEIIILNNGE